MKAITVEELARLAKSEVAKGNGKKQILLSADDEGNEFHQMYFGFTPTDKVLCGKYPPLTDIGDNDPNDYIILG